MDRSLSVDTNRSLGKINISPEAISVIAGATAMESFGVVGMSSRSLQDGIAELFLGRENLTKGIEVRINEEQVILDLYVVVEYGTRINEVAHNVIENVKYAIEDQLGLSVLQVNVNVMGVRTGNSV